MKILSYFLAAIALLILAILLTKELGFLPRFPYLQNFEEQEFAGTSSFIDPLSVEDGLAVYSVGSGEPVLLFPYPHAHTREPVAQGPIANTLVDMGRTVITFDVPGAYKSTAAPNGDMAEMLTSAKKSLDTLGVTEPIDVVGHSMGGLAALAFAIEHPHLTKRLVLIGSTSGFPAVLKYGMPKSVWKITDVEYWKFIFIGLKVKTGFGSLADHKQLCNIMARESYHEKSLFIPFEIEPDDHSQGIPIREMVWGKNLFQNLDYSDRLTFVDAPTLILVGRHDPETPLPVSEKLHEGIPNSLLVVFEQSGHSPHLEEPELFYSVVSNFFQTGSGE